MNSNFKNVNIAWLGRVQVRPTFVLCMLESEPGVRFKKSSSTQNIHLSPPRRAVERGTNESGRGGGHS